MRLYMYRDLKAAGVPWTRKHLYCEERLGRFPKRVHLSANTIAWVADEIDRFVADRIAAREDIGADEAA